MPEGDYIALLDVDDLWRSHKLQQQLSIPQSQPRAAMVYGMSQYWFSWTGNSEDFERDYIPSLGFQADMLFECSSLLLLPYPFVRPDSTAPALPPRALSIKAVISFTCPV